METIKDSVVDLKKFLVVDDWEDRGRLCLSDKDCEIAEAINRAMETVCRKYFAMSEESLRLSSGLRFSL